jgi:hypothetical protein
MKIRTLSIACVTTAAVLSAGCTAVYKNSDACEQMMRGKFAEASSEKLTLSHTGAGIHGERVVVEGRYEQAPLQAVDAAAIAAGASGASAAEVVAGVPAPKTIAALNPPASAPVAPVTSQPAGKKKKIFRDAAAECQFDGLNLTAFRWLSPAELAHPADEANGEASE